jgi:hypothetical protein
MNPLPGSTGDAASAVFVATSRRSGLLPALAMLLVWAVAATSTAFAGGPLVETADGSPAVWNTTAAVPYHTDLGGLGTLSQADAVTLTAALFGRWHQVPTALIDYARAGSLSVNVNGTNFGPYLGPFGGSTTPLGSNAMVFDADGAIFDTLFGVGTGVLGFASPTFFSDGATTVPLGSNVPAGAHIVEGLAFFNGKWIDGISNPGGGNPEMPLARFEAVIVHEFGHFSGLDHTQIHGLAYPPSSDISGTTTPYETMFPFNFDATQSTLGRDDEVALSNLYPAPGFAASTGRIEGRVLDRIGRPLAGINVIARNVADDGDAVSCVTSVTFPSPGAYALAGLTAGASYRVEVQEIDVFHSGGSGVGPFSPPRTLPGPPELYNGASESADPAVDDPAAATPITAQAGVTVPAVDIRINAQPFGVTNVSLGETRGPWEIATGDFDGDGITDFVATQLGFVPGNLIRFYRGLGQGRFAPPVTVDVFNGNEDIVAGHFNAGADSYLDIAVASRSVNEVRIYLGDGAGGFSSPATILNAADTDTLLDLKSGDLDSDGSADLLTILQHPSGGGVTVHALLGSPSGAFVDVLTSLPASAAAPLSAIVLGQFNGSPAPDVVGVSSAGPSVSGSPVALAILTGSGSGSFTSSSVSLSAFSERVDPLGIAAGDFDEDGKLDLALSDLNPVGGPPNYTRSFIDILRRTGSGFTLSARYDVPETFQRAIAVADLSGDGNLDVATTGASFAPGNPGAKVTVAFGAGNGTIASKTSVWGLAEFPEVIAAADLDGNGSTDLLVSDGATGPQSLDLTAAYSVLLHLPACAAAADCDDGDLCNGAESCDLPLGECLQGTPPTCDDADPCTSDSCGQDLVLLADGFENVIDWIASSRGGANTWHQDRYTCFGNPFPSTMLASNGNAGPTCVAGSSIERSQLLSPLVTLPGAGTASLSLDALSFDEAGSCLASGARDAHDVGITTNGGATYTVLNDCTPLADGSGLLVHHQFDLSAFMGQTVQVIFVYDTRDAATGHTFAVDNVTITARPDGCAHTATLPDADQDFHPNALCGGDDCDDADPSAWGVPVEVTNLGVNPPAPAGVSWDGQGFLVGPATLYDLASGALLQAPRVSYGSSVCLQTGTSTSHVDGRANPPLGTGYWYLVRGRNTCGTGTYGSPAQDSQILSCP